MTKRPTFEKAKASYPHRFTMEHVPTWAREVRQDGSFYAPQYRTDREWYDRTLFPGEAGSLGGKDGAWSSDPTWPMGQGLASPYRIRANA